jgi:biopolymer transport protein ExbD
LATRGLPDEAPEFQIAPMIDILLVLLVFFMSIATEQVAQTSDGLLLPVAKFEKPTGIDDFQEVYVSIHWKPEGGIQTEVDGKGQMGGAALIAYVKERKENARFEFRVIIRADKRVNYRDVRATMDSVEKAGVRTIIFSVTDQTNPE